MTAWDLLGEDYDAMFCGELLPLTWRTKAKALLAYAAEIGKPDALEWLPLSRITVAHGVVHWAPPESEWWGGEYVSCDKAPTPAPHGWYWSEQVHEQCGDFGGIQCVSHDLPDAVCLVGTTPFKPTTADLFRAARAAGPEIHCITTGGGDEWLCRVIGPATVVSFQ